MHRVAGLNPATSTWYHTFQIPYMETPKLVFQGELSLCQTDESKATPMETRNCRLIRKTIQQLTSRSQTAIPFQIVRSPRKWLSRSCPNGRKRAGVKEVCCLSSLFGSATEDEVAAVQANVDKLKQMEILTKNRVEQMSGQLSSFMHVADARITHATEAIAQNCNTTLLLQKTIVKLYVVGNIDKLHTL